MKHLFRWIGMAVLGISLFFTLPKAKAQPAYSATYQDFYDGLAPYGQWINDPQYGYVWLPDVGSDFRPYYTNGYWAMTEYGNTWVSDYQWGWAPFHYGRWTYDNYYGWLWIPDTQWGPAWVSWRSNNSYYGWAPMGPGLNINISIGSIPIDWWVFLSPNYFYDRSFQRYYGGYRNNQTIFYQTTIINNTYYDNRYRTTYYCGPGADDYRRRTGRNANVYVVNDNGRRGATSVRGNRISMYRPAMNNVSNAAPSRVAVTDKSVGRRPQSFSGNTPTGRQQVLQQEPVRNTGRRPAMNTPANNGNTTMPARQQSNNQNTATPSGGRQATDQSGTRRAPQILPQEGQQQQMQQVQQSQQRTQQAQQQMLQQRTQQIQQQNTQQDQQRAQQAQQQQMQQQRAQQAQQQQQMQQQRAQQAQQQQMQQQRAQQDQQRAQQAQQQQQMQQQRAQQAQQQQMQQQRAQQDQQRAQQAQQQQQMQQQRAQQAQQQQQMQQQRAQQAQPQRSQEAQPARQADQIQRR